MFKWTYLFIGLFFSLILMGSEAKPSTDQLLWETMNKLEMRVERTVYHHGERISYLILTNQLDQLVEKMASDLRLGVPTKQVNRDGIRYEASGTHGNVTTDLTVVNDQFMKTWSKPFISIRIMQRGQKYEQSIYQRFAQFLARYQLKPNIDCSMQGSKPYQDERFEHLLTKTFRYLHASEVEAARTKQMMSISGWSPRLSGSLQTRGGQMNLQVATRLDEQTNRLLFTIGSPIITIEY